MLMFFKALRKVFYTYWALSNIKKRNKINILFTFLDPSHICFKMGMYKLFFYYETFNPEKLGDFWRSLELQFRNLNHRLG